MQTHTHVPEHFCFTSTPLALHTVRYPQFYLCIWIVWSRVGVFPWRYQLSTLSQAHPAVTPCGWWDVKIKEPTSQPKQSTTKDPLKMMHHISEANRQEIYHYQKWVGTLILFFFFINECYPFPIAQTSTARDCEYMFWRIIKEKSALSKAVMLTLEHKWCKMQDWLQLSI